LGTFGALRIDMMLKRGFAFACTLGLIVGCGGSAASSSSQQHPADQPPAPPANPGTPPAPPLDHGSPSDKYPAFTPDVPQLQNRGGHVLSNPVVVTITWPGDANADTFEHIGDTLGATQYWKETTSEYGVGPLTSGPTNHVRLTAANAPTISTGSDPVEQLATWLGKELTDPASGFPAPTDQTIYAMYINGQTAADICNAGAGGLHESTVVAGKNVAYALINQCDPGPGAPFDMMGETTISASHELAEASVDPWPDASPAWQGVDDQHLATELLVQGNDENADLCDMEDDSYSALPPEITFMVERTWSNKSALAGHSPCVPAPAGAYFSVSGVTPKDDVKADFSVLGPSPFSDVSKGYKIGIGETKQIALGIWSDAPTADIQLEAMEVDPFDTSPSPDGKPSNPTLDVALDKTSGKNGEKTYLTVKVNKSNAVGVQVVTVALTIDKKLTRYVPVLVGGNPPDPAAQAALQKAIDSGKRRLNPLKPKWH
jgi:hypothetical protein